MRELERDFPTPSAVRDDSLTSLTIVGSGRVGGALARAGQTAGLDVRLAGRDGALEACADAEAVLLTVPDAEIAAAAELIAAAVPPLRFAGHTSGATPLSALDACAARGASTFSIHPLQTVPDAETDLTGTPSAVAGSDAAALTLATDLAQRLGLRPFAVAEANRAAYHAAAVIASNFLVTLEESAAALLSRAGVEKPRELLAPLVLRTAANWSERGGAALTGPIARGDQETIERHRAALAELAPEMLAAYDALAERTAAIAGEREAG